MSDSSSVSRRALLGYAGAGIAASGAGGSAVVRPAAARPSLPPLAALVAPLAAGSALGRWRVERLIEPEGGAASIVLTDGAGAEFQLDVCARDPSPGASRGPAITEHFEIFVANQGDGATGTNEDHGLCAMALGEVIRGNEALAARTAFVTLAEREAPRRHVRA